MPGSLKTRSGFKQKKDSSRSNTDICVAHSSTAKKQYQENENLRPVIGSVEKEKATDAIDPPRCYTLYTDSSLITPASPVAQSATA